MMDASRKISVNEHWLRELETLRARNADLLKALEAYLKGQEAAEHLAGPANTYDWRGFSRDMADVFRAAIDKAKPVV